MKWKFGWKQIYWDQTLKDKKKTWHGKHVDKDNISQILWQEVIVHVS